MKTKSAVVALSALAQESRLEVFRLLVRTGPEGLGAGEISNRLDLGKSTLSFHLKELQHAGLIRSCRDGRNIIYSLEETGIRSLLGFLTEDCCQGRDDLCLPANAQPACC